MIALRLRKDGMDVVKSKPSALPLPVIRKICAANCQAQTAQPRYRKIVGAEEIDPRSSKVDKFLISA